MIQFIFATPIIILFAGIVVFVLLLKMLFRAFSTKTKQAHPGQHTPLYRRDNLMNKSETLLFYKLESWVVSLPGWHRVCPQVALPEILKSKDRVAFNKISRKRCDFIIIDSKGYPIIAIEYQGSGHYRGDAKKRDAIKRAALESASVAYVEVFPGYNWDNLKAELNKAIHVPSLDK